MRLPTLGCAAFGWAWVFTREFPSEPASWLWAIPLAAFAAVVLTVIYLLIGALAFWLGETAPVHWVCQKLLFVLGGLMLPLELYPRTLLTVAHLTPFPAMLYAPASLVLGTAGTSAGTVACWLGVWFALLVALAALLLRSAHRKLQLGGG